MTITATEVGKLFNYSTSYDLSAPSATFEITLTDPDGVKTVIPNNRITAPSADFDDPELGLLPGDTYMQFTTIASDFPVGGDWIVCGTYNDATPKVFYGKKATFPVHEPC